METWSTLKYKRRRGFSLLEVIIAMVILMIIALGSLYSEFLAVKTSMKSDAKMTASRIGSVIIENWKATGGSENFDPTEQSLGISKFQSGDFYKFTVDGVPYYLSFFSEDMATNETTGVTLRKLSVVIQWCENFEDNMPGASDPSMTLHNYVRLDQSGG